MGRPQDSLICCKFCITLIKFEVNDGCGGDTGCYGIKVKMDAAKLLNMIIGEMKFGVKR